MREVKVGIKLSGGKEAAGEVRPLISVFDQLEESAKRDLNSIQRTLNNVDTKQVATAIKQINANGGLDETNKDARELQKILDSVDGTQIDEAAQSIKELGDETQRAAGVYQDANGRMRDANGKFIKSARDAEQAVDALGNAVADTSKQFDKLKDAGNTVQNFGNQVQGLGQSLTVGLTAPIVGLGILAVKTFADVELAVAEISSIKPEIDTSLLLRQLNEMSERVPQTAQQLGDGLYNIFSSIEISQGDALKLLESFAKGATAAKTDAATFGTAVLGVMNAYKLEVADAAHISDVFFNTVNLGVVNGAQLATQLGVVTQAAKNAGVGFDELGALIVGVTKEGGDAAQNINNLSNMLMKLPTKESSAALKQLGVDVQIDGKFRPVIDVLADLKTKLDAMTPSARALAMQEIFPDAQARTGAQTLLSQLDAVKEALVVNQTAAGAANSAYQKIAATASVQFQLLKNTTVAILSLLGSGILPVLQPMIVWLAQNLVPAVKNAVEVFKSWSPVMRTIAVGVAAFVAAIGPALVIIGTIIVAVGSVISSIGAIGGALATASGAIIAAGSVTALLGAAFAAVGTFITATLIPLLTTLAPVILGVVAVLAAVAAGAVALYAAWSTNFGNIQGTVSEFVAMVTEAFNSLLTVIQPAVDAVSAYAVEGFNQINEWWATNGQEINQAAETIFATLLVIVGDAIETIKQFWADNGEWITEFTSATWSAIKATISGVMMIISGIIKTTAGIINGDWSAVWSGLGSIAGGALQTAVSIIGAGLILALGALRGGLDAIWSLGSFILQQADKLAQYLVDGLVNGINRGAERMRTAAWNAITGVINVFREVPIVRSPSKVTTEIGEFIGEGLAVGIENKAVRVKAAAKKVADDTIKTLQDALKEFQKYAGMSPEGVGRSIEANRNREGASDLQKIIKLRAENGDNLRDPLPTTVDGAAAEVKNLEGKIKRAADAQKEFDESLEALQKGSEKLQGILQKDAEAFEKLGDSIREKGALGVIDLQEEISLLGVTDPMEKQRVQNAFDLLRMREQLTNDGYAEEQIAELLEIQKVEQSRLLELQQIKTARENAIGAEKAYGDLLSELNGKMMDGVEMSEAMRVAKVLEGEAYKNLSQAQKDNLIAIAAEVDAQRAARAAFEETRDTARDLLDILTESGTSMKDRFGNVFKYIADRFKRMLIDMAADWIASKFFKGFGAGSAQSGGAQPGGGFSPMNILQGLFGGGASSGGFGGTAPFNPGAGNFTPGNMGGQGIAFGGSAGSMSHELGHLGATGGGGSAWTNLKQMFSSKEGGLFAPVGGSKGAGYASGAGSLMAMAGSLIGGKWGGLLSSTGSGMAMGAQIGALFGPIGAGIGAAVGAAAGFVMGLFGMNKQRKEDEKTRTTAYQAVLKDFDQIITQLKASPQGITSSQAMSRVDEVIKEYNANMGQLKDSKTRRIALAEVTSPTGLIYKKKKQVEEAAAIAKTREEIRDAAAERDRRIVPEFNSGIYMDAGFASQYGAFKRRNGMLPGSWTGRDTLPSMLAMGEMVLNPMQQAAIRARAGGDVFAGVVPNYKPQSSGVPHFASGVDLSSGFSSNSSAAPVINFSPVMNFYMEREENGDLGMYLDTPEGKRKVGKVVEDGFYNGTIKPKRR